MTLKDFNWYVVKLVYQITRRERGNPEFDFQWRLIFADEEAWATEKAETLGKVGERFFFKDQRQVHRKFLGVVDLVKVESANDAMLLYSQTEKPGESGVYKMLKNYSSRLNKISTTPVVVN